MHEETVFNKLDLVPEKLLNFIEYMDAANDDAILITVGDPVIGVFIGEVYSHMFTHDLVAVDQLMYVHNSYRRGGIARDMVEQYRDWAKGKGAKLDRDWETYGCKPLQ